MPRIRKSAAARDAGTSITEAGDLALLEGWCEGSKAAGDQLFRRCLPLLHRFFIRKAGEATDDLVQKTLMVCLRNRRKMLDSGAFEPYLLRIARSRLYDHLREQRRNSGGPDQHVGDAASHATAACHSTHLCRERRAMEIRETVSRIPVDLRRVVELHYWGELSTAEIAELLDLRHGTVKSRLRRAREALHRELVAAGAEVLEHVAEALPKRYPVI